jgi:hypothetical protein
MPLSIRGRHIEKKKGKMCIWSEGADEGKMTKLFQREDWKSHGHKYVRVSQRGACVVDTR